MTFRNYYSTKEKKQEFQKIVEGESLTDQSQYASASIREMAKRFGIDAIMAKAEQMTATESLKDHLYGNDFTKMFKSKDELLNVKKRLRERFELIPARMRKTIFNDDIEEFVNAYTYNDINKLTELNKVGIISTTQLEQAIAYDNKLKETAKENALKTKFIAELEKQKEGLYDTYKKTGSINLGNNQSNTVNNPISEVSTK